MATDQEVGGVINQDEEYIGPIGLLCSFLGADPGTAAKNKQWNEYLHSATSA